MYLKKGPYLCSGIYKKELYLKHTIDDKLKQHHRLWVQVDST